MKILLILWLFNSDYCSGFEYGFKQGYCYQKTNCITPLTPLCPIRNYNEKNTFEDGYNKGFITGINYNY